MSRTALTVQETSRDGLEPSYTAGNADGHSVANEGKKTFVHVKNGSAASITATFQTSATVDGLAVADKTVSVPAGEERMVGPFPTAYYGTTLSVDLSAVTTVTIAAIKVGS
jgi:hypothetical protein